MHFSVLPINPLKLIKVTGTYAGWRHPRVSTDAGNVCGIHAAAKWKCTGALAFVKRPTRPRICPLETAGEETSTGTMWLYWVYKADPCLFTICECRTRTVLPKKSSRTVAISPSSIARTGVPSGMDLIKPFESRPSAKSIPSCSVKRRFLSPHHSVQSPNNLPDRKNQDSKPLSFLRSFSHPGKFSAILSGGMDSWALTRTYSLKVIQRV